MQLKPNVGKDKDPMAGIMDLMKVIYPLCFSIVVVSNSDSDFFSVIYLQNMYEEGDDEMKRTIAKAWSDARSGKSADPLKNYP